MVWNPEEAEEITQQTFFQAFVAWNNFKGKSKTQTWLFRIAVNACKQHMMDKKKRSTETLEDYPNLAEVQPKGQTARASLIHEAMNQIAPAHRLALTLFCIDELKHQEVAEILDVPIGTAWSRLSKAKKALEAKMIFFEKVSQDG